MISTLVAQKKDDDEKFYHFLESIKGDMDNLDVEAFLLLPIQQITRYPILLERIKKYTPQQHPDYQSVTKAHAYAIEMTKFANEQQRFAELQIKLVQINEQLLVPGECDGFKLVGDHVSLLHVYDFQWMQPKDPKDRGNPRKVHACTSIKIDVEVKGHDKKGVIKEQIKRVKDSGARKVLIMSDTVTGHFVVMLGEVTESSRMQYLLLTERIPIEVLELVPQTHESHVAGVDFETDIMVKFRTIWMAKEGDRDTCYVVLKADRSSKKDAFEELITNLKENNQCIEQTQIEEIRKRYRTLKASKGGVDERIHQQGSVESCFVNAAAIIERLMPMIRGSNGSTLSATDKQLVKTIMLDGPDIKLREAEMEHLENKIQLNNGEHDRDVLKMKEKQLALRNSNCKLQAEVEALRRLEAGNVLILQQQHDDQQSTLQELEEAEVAIDELEGTLEKYKGIASELEKSGYDLKSELHRLKIGEQTLQDQIEELQREKRGVTSGASQARWSVARLGVKGKVVQQQKGEAQEEVIGVFKDRLKEAKDKSESFRKQVDALRAQSSTLQEDRRSAADEAQTKLATLEIKLTKAKSETKAAQLAAEQSAAEVAKLNGVLEQKEEREQQADDLIKAIEAEMMAMQKSNIEMQHKIAGLNKSNIALLAAEERRQSQLQSERRQTVSTQEELETERSHLSAELVLVKDSNEGLRAEVDTLTESNTAHEEASAAFKAQLEELQSAWKEDKEATRLLQLERDELAASIRQVEESRASLEESLEASSTTQTQAMEVIGQLKDKIGKYGVTKEAAERRASVLEQTVQEMEHVTGDLTQQLDTAAAEQAKAANELEATRNELKGARDDIKAKDVAAAIIADQAVAAQEELKKVQGEKFGLEEKLASSYTESVLAANARDNNGKDVEALALAITGLETEKAALVQTNAELAAAHDAMEAEIASLMDSQEKAEDAQALFEGELQEKVRALEEELGSTAAVQQKAEIRIEEESQKSQAAAAAQLDLEQAVEAKVAQVRVLEIELSGAKAAIESMEDEMCQALDAATEQGHALELERGSFPRSLLVFTSPFPCLNAHPLCAPLSLSLSLSLSPLFSLSLPPFLSFFLSFFLSAPSSCPSSLRAVPGPLLLRCACL